MRYFLVFCVAVLLLASWSGTADAHSREGLVKVTLKSATLTVDHVAYYLEAEVNNRPDEDGRRYRFIIWDFERIDHLGDVAHVHVIVNDQKTAQQFKETLYLTRNPDNTWNHVDSERNLITANIYTMVPPTNMTLYAASGAGGLAVVGLAAWAVVRRRKRRDRTQDVNGAEKTTVENDADEPK